MNRSKNWITAVTLVVCCLPWIDDSRAQNIGTPVSITVGTLPDDAAMIFWSTRNESSGLAPSNLYVANINGGSVTQMTFSAKSYEHTSLSFDRRYIAANRYVNGASQLWIIDLKNRTEVRLLPTYYSTGGGGTDWSPDGFVFFASRQINGGADQIYKMKADGTQLTQLTSLVLDPYSTPPDPAGAGDVSVSEDGSKVAYVRTVARLFPDGSWGPKTQIWAMNSDGTDQHLVYDDPRPAGLSGSDPIGTFDPEFSPDNSRLVFSRTNLDYLNFPQYNVNTAHDIVTLNADGTGDLFNVTSPGPVSIIPDWQNGKIVYTEYWDSTAIGSGTTYTGSVVINPDGTGKTRLESGLALWRGARHSKFIRPTTNPTACSGQWSSCTQAFTSTSDRAFANNVTATSTKTGTWNNYGFTLPTTSTIHSVTVMPMFYASNTGGQIEVSVSGDGGATYGAPHVVGGNTSEQTFIIDVTGDRAWTASMLTNANFKIQVKCFKQGSGNSNGNLRWLPVKVSYTP
jgi:hypothetical protein